VGVVEYEVGGRAVDLAQRFESFRKLYFPDSPPGHVITVHAALYQQLPSHLQKNFISVDLCAASLVMRDDPMATHVYYCLLSPDAVRDSLQIFRLTLSYIPKKYMIIEIISTARDRFSG
jgi:hypothetical protein